VTCFCEEGESITDEERSGWPATSRTEENTAKVHQIVCENCQLSGASKHRQRNRKILTGGLDVRNVRYCTSVFSGRTEKNHEGQSR
jgi:hypothetical protein